MEFSNIAGHVSVIQHLQSAFSRDRIPSAYLFVGLNGIGKSTLARAFAQMLNCQTHNNCHNCESCKMFEKGMHPDFLNIESEGKFIKIRQIQSLIKQLSLKPVYASKRVVLIEDAQKMNVEAANCFLKILEEPPLDTLIILLTTDETLLMETTVSRTQIIHFSQLGMKQVKTILKNNYSLSENETTFLLNYSQGRIRLDFIKKITTLYNLREQVVHLLQHLKNEYMVDHFALIEHTIKQDLGFYFLEFCSGWIHDWLIVTLGNSRKIINDDLMDEVQNIPKHLSSEGLLSSFDLIIETEISLKAHAGKLLVLDALIVKIKQLFSGNRMI